MCHVIIYQFLCIFSLDLNMTEQQRRVSMGAAMKSNFVVSQSDLWDTQTLSHAKQHSRHSPRNNQARCPDHTYVNAPLQQGQQQQPQSTPSSSLATTPQHEFGYHENGSPGGISTGSGSGIMQRSVSEKNRKHRHKQKVPVCQSETDSEREQRIEAQLCAQNRKLVKSHHSHHQSVPNVAPECSGSQTSIKMHKHRSKSRDHHHHRSSSSIVHGAFSESELLDSDTAILPIFRKLLTEKESRYRHKRSVVGASCPNISIKCDIVEYL
jgi:gamma-aminobutyric acid type B receptor